VLAAIATIATVLSSILPALLVARADPQKALQAFSRGVGSRAVSNKWSGTLVAGEVALSMLLLVGTGLLFHTLWNLGRVRLGFDVARVTTFQAMPADAAGFSNMAVSEDTANAPTSVAVLTYRPVLDRIRAVPGVAGAALISTPPLGGMNVGSSFSIVGEPQNSAAKPHARVSAVSGDYARTMSTPVIRGRMVSDDDVLTAPFVTAVNQTLVKKYFPNGDPLGRQIDIGGKGTGMIRPYTIVGVLGDQVDSSVGGEIQPFIMVPAQQVPTTSLFYQALLKTVVSFVVKTRGDIPVAAPMRSVFHQTAPGFALDNFQTMEEAVAKNTFSQRLGSQLVSYRRREIGIRMALGATRQSVATLILRQGSILIGSGLAAGLVLALFTARFVKSFLYQVPPVDMVTYVGVAVLLSLIGLVAVLLPARRAASIEPMQALRED
jgi:putative ABC transport system permease protein